MGRRRGAYRSSGLRRPGGWRLLYGTACAVAAVAVVLALVRTWVTVAAAAGITAALTAALGMVVERLRDLSLWPDHLAKARPGQVPRVREVDDPSDWTARPARAAGALASPYVERDVDGELSGALVRGGFVLLLGEAAAGKSRTAFEGVRGQLPEHAWIRPFTRASLGVAVDAARTCAPSVLWLDDLENYLGDDGLTEARMDHLHDRPERRVVVVATLRDEEHRRYDTREGSRLTGSDRDLWRAERHVLDRATVVRVERLWSAAEIRRARALAPNRRMGLALAASARFGIAESLACGPELVHVWRDAWGCGGHPRGAAVVATVVDCRRAGLRRPVPLAWVRVAHEAYLAARGGDQLRPEPLDEALDWACQTIRATSSLLLRGADRQCLTCFDYLLGCDGLEPVPDHLWEALLPRVPAQEAYDMGLVAHGELRLRHARGALAKAREGRVTGAEFALALVIGDAGHPRRAMEMLRGLPPHEAAACRAADPLALPQQLAHFQGVAGEYAASARAFRELAGRMAQILGADHPDTLAARHQAAYYAGESGRTAMAIDELSALASDRRRVLGADHHQTLATRRSLAWFRGRAGQQAQAVAELSNLLAEAQPVLGLYDPHVLAVRAALAWFRGEAGDWDRSCRELTDVLEDRQRVLGPEHPHTLATRHQLAVATAHGGDRRGAREQLDALLPDMRHHLAHDHPHVVAARRSLMTL